jgi:hypothetical protein
MKERTRWVKAIRKADISEAKVILNQLMNDVFEHKQKEFDEIKNQRDELLEAYKKEHSIDEQTHGLKFGYSKYNCGICKAIANCEKRG